MNLSDKIQLETNVVFVNEKLNEVNITKWIDLGKCLIMPNTSAAKIKGNDGKDFIYSYEVIMRKPKEYIPKENDMVHIIKKDRTIDKICRVSGFVTLKNWLKIWV